MLMAGDTVVKNYCLLNFNAYVFLTQCGMSHDLTIRDLVTTFRRTKDNPASFYSDWLSHSSLKILSCWRRAASMAVQGTVLPFMIRYCAYERSARRAGATAIQSRFSIARASDGVIAHVRS
jgi:hypothetical protein